MAPSARNTVLPLLGEREFGLTAYTARLTFIVAFGIGPHQPGRRDPRRPIRPETRAGRGGWWASRAAHVDLGTDLGWVVAANVLLGVNQGFTWSTTVIMKIDLAGPERRGLAMGLNEAAGYGALAAAAATGWIAANHGLRPEPFLLGAAYIAIGLGCPPCSSGDARPRPTRSRQPRGLRSR